MSGYELAKTFDSSIGFFWKADHQQIYRELSKLRIAAISRATRWCSPASPTSWSIR